MAKGNRRDAQDRRRRALIPLALFVLVAGAGGAQLASWALDPANLPIRTIQIKNGFRNLDKAGLQRALSKAVDGGFFSLDLAQVRQAALSLPWVAEARVTRVWPDKLVVEVTEQVAVARWNENALLNAHGEIFSPEKPQQHLQTIEVELRGPDKKAATMLAFYRVLQPQFARLNLGIREIELDARGEWRLRLTDGLQITIGKEQKDYRIQRLLGVFAALAGNQRKPRQVDLRYEQGFAIAWRERNES